LIEERDDMLGFTTIRLVIQTSQVSKVDGTAFDSKQFTTTHNTIHTEGCVCSLDASI